MIRLTDEERLQERREGQEEGKREGRKEGRKEREIEIVKNLFNKGMDITFVSEITGLSEQEIGLLKLK